MNQLLLGFILGVSFIIDVFFILWLYSGTKQNTDYEFLGASIGR
jgi:hypothetical protein